MTDKRDEGFLGRWSRLKRRGPAEPPDQPAETAAEAEAAGPIAEEAVDPATLPPIESLDAASDYSVFLKPGVPAQLRALALRRAWVTDPAITGYKTLADYDWDFNAPGYGALRVTDDVAEAVRRVFGLIERDEEPVGPDGGPAPGAEPEEEEEKLPPAALVAEAAPDPASEHVFEPVAETAAPLIPEPEPIALPEPSAPAAPRRRRHGGAVPRLPDGKVTP